MTFVVICVIFLCPRRIDAHTCIVPREGRRSTRTMLLSVILPQLHVYLSRLCIGRIMAACSDTYARRPPHVCVNDQNVRPHDALRHV